MRALLTALTALMLCSAPSTAKDLEDAFAAYKAGDYQRAFRLLAPQAKQGHAEAQFNLGMMYFKGNGVQKDYGKAMHWYRRAAERGHAEAQSNLGLMYATGLGVSKDFVEAYAWWDIATEQGNDDAKHNKTILEYRMKSEQIAKAKGLSSVYWEMYVMPFQYY
tara:strand:+ start:1557 stop:2045 length:489 start_codon:yes stop_codon:yes gene_type:complete